MTSLLGAPLSASRRIALMPDSRMRLSLVMTPKRFPLSWISAASMSNAMPSYTWSAESPLDALDNFSSPPSWMRFHMSCHTARIGNPCRQVLYPAGALGEHCALANCSRHVFLLLVTSLSARSHLAWEAGVPPRRRAAATPSRSSVLTFPWRPLGCRGIAPGVRSCLASARSSTFWAFSSSCSLGPVRLAADPHDVSAWAPLSASRRIALMPDSRMRLSRVMTPKRFRIVLDLHTMPSYTWSAESCWMPSIFNSSPSSWMRFHMSCHTARIGNPFRQVL
eukprot:CAMPEP_0203974028 /NCGR_PEP_ID=MMETSP0359-20131031/99893_1 /ASSEMBLY_ACC=CAM_ASM_000338 /TAXON_ID=268821 /ORGANISM="Scrippsiella Hangoei, Strain SHTV-5" /LENGTH=278 /DNA_ID=CAMNT_0050912201 /DNA_START=304 /DNA_END=1134 /DNA_ORIENTATION=+